MRMRILASTLVVVAVSGCAVAQTPKAEEDHSAHHPVGSVPVATAPAARAAVPPDAFDKQVKAMQDMHQRLQSARTPAERAALMDEHMKLMQSGMAMMGQMRGMASPGGPGGMGMMAPPSGGAGPSQGTPGTAGMMGMHQQMERRMALMEQMMQMMVDREAAVPRK